MPEAFVGIGSNTDPARALRAAVAGLARRFGPIRVSAVYRSAAVGVRAADYLNMAAALVTTASVGELREALRALEAAAGRTRADPAVCELDLDLLLYGCRVDPAERLPRPGAFALPFVVVPLAELAPDLVHPLTGERCGAAAERGRRALERLGAVDALG